MYPHEHELKDTTKNNTSSSYFDLLLSIGRYVPLRQAWRFKFPYYKLSVPEQQRPIFASVVECYFIILTLFTTFQ